MSPKHTPYQTLDDQERERMTELLDLLTATPEAESSAPLHEKIGALAELQLLIGAHNANGSRFIRELVSGELDRLRDDLHTIYDPLALLIERQGQRMDEMSARQDTFDTRLSIVEVRQKGGLERVDALERRQDRLEIRVRLNSTLLVLVALSGLIVTIALHLLLP